MQGFFGVGAHITQLLAQLKKQAHIKITLVFYETQKYPQCHFVTENEVDTLYIPCPQNGLSLSTQEDIVHPALAVRLLQAMQLYLPQQPNMVFWFNELSEFHVIKKVKDFYNCKVLYVHHGWAWKDVYKVSDAVFAKAWKDKQGDYFLEGINGTALQLQLVENADKTICVTKQAFDFFRNALGVPQQKLSVIYNGIMPPALVQIDSAVLRAELGIREQEKIILFSGRAVGNKGIFYLVEAFKILLQTQPNCRLVIAGTGHYPEILKAAEGIWHKVTLTGFINSEWMQKWYTVASLAVLPSIMEQCSYTAIEFRFFKIPAIVSAVDGLDEMFEDEVDCLKLPLHYDKAGNREFKPIELADRMLRLLNNKPLADRITMQSFQKAMDYFTSEKMAASYVKVIGQMLADEIVEAPVYSL